MSIVNYKETIKGISGGTQELYYGALSNGRRYLHGIDFQPDDWNKETPDWSLDTLVDDDGKLILTSFISSTKTENEHIVSTYTHDVLINEETGIKLPICWRVEYQLGKNGTSFELRESQGIPGNPDLIVLDNVIESSRTDGTGILLPMREMPDFVPFEFMTEQEGLLNPLPKARSSYEIDCYQSGYDPKWRKGGIVLRPEVASKHQIRIGYTGRMVRPIIQAKDVNEALLVLIDDSPDVLRIVRNMEKIGERTNSSREPILWSGKPVRIAEAYSSVDELRNAMMLLNQRARARSVKSSN